MADIQTSGSTREMYFLTVPGAEIQNHGAIRVGFWWELSPWLEDGCLLAVCSPGLSSVLMYKDRESSLGVSSSSYKDISLIRTLVLSE